MPITYILYNPIAGSGKAKERIEEVKKFVKENEIKYLDLTHIDCDKFIKKLPPQDDIIICGGDGTLNKFVNSIESTHFENDLFYYAIGTGNDFLRDVAKADERRPIRISNYIHNLPEITLNRKTQKFINNIGYGIDGYVCGIRDEKYDRNEDVNYTAIALKGLIYDFSPRNAKVTVDGKEYNFKKTWLAPTMNGRYFGGGMMIAPDQDRTSGKVTLVAIHDKSRLTVLLEFPKIFKGEHKNLKNVEIFVADEVTVEFDVPCYLQVDGELHANISGYSVKSYSHLLSNK